MIGRLNDTLEALVEVLLSGQRGRAQVACVIDTGYTGALLLSEHVVSNLGLAYAGSLRARLADGSLVALPRYEVEIVWMGGPRVVLASAVPAENALIGTALLDGHRLTIDYGACSVEVV